VIGTRIDANPVDAIALPRLVRPRPDLIGRAFPLMKRLPARSLVRKALEEGALTPGGPVAGTGSGTSGLARAMVARLGGHGPTRVRDIFPMTKERS
jgi:cysteine synthase